MVAPGMRTNQRKYERSVSPQPRYCLTSALLSISIFLSIRFPGRKKYSQSPKARSVTPGKRKAFSAPLDVFSFSRYAEGRACPVSGSISVVNDLTRTHPIETVIRKELRFDFRAVLQVSTNSNVFRLYLCLEKQEFQALSWETLDVVNRPTLEVFHTPWISSLLDFDLELV